MQGHIITQSVSFYNITLIQINSLVCINMYNATYTKLILKISKVMHLELQASISKLSHYRNLNSMVILCKTMMHFQAYHLSLRQLRTSYCKWYTCQKKLQMHLGLQCSSHIYLIAAENLCHIPWIKFENENREDYKQNCTD